MHRLTFLVALWFTGSATLSAQDGDLRGDAHVTITVAPGDAPRASERGDGPTAVSKTAQVGGLILTGAAGAQLIGSPEAWARSWPHFGYRIADQTGFYLVQTSTARALARARGYRPDSGPCPRDEVIGCAFTATFTHGGSIPVLCTSSHVAY